MLAEVAVEYTNLHLEDQKLMGAVGVAMAVIVMVLLFSLFQLVVLRILVAVVEDVDMVVM
jgi:hypothetical protein